MVVKGQNNSRCKVGKKYRIKTKNGIVEKYLSYIDEKNKLLYFVKSEGKINSKKLGFMYGTRGTNHNIKNVIGEIKDNPCNQ